MPNPASMWGLVRAASCIFRPESELQLSLRALSIAAQVTAAVEVPDRGSSRASTSFTMHVPLQAANLPSKVKLVEVGPRDGLQNEQVQVRDGA